MKTVNSDSTLKREGNTASIIYDRLRADIMSGKLAPGTSLSQLTIAKESGTSRGPVREALWRLQKDQLVIGFANRRFSVAPSNLSDLETVLSLHLATVTIGIRVSVPVLTDAEIADLHAHHHAMEKAVDHDTVEWEAAYRRFIATLLTHSGERTVSIVNGLIDDIQRYRANLLDRFPRVYAGGPEFERVLEDAQRRDGERASVHFVDFFGRLASLILAGASPRYDTARLRRYITALIPGPLG